ncbi:type III-B CRISPR-associated protein Cas10/Cmr2 [Saccharolobus islandicus]|uniref:CRISPR-associated protein, Cas10 n=1 Tax=Saccharolobus islandicus LAL14/1 TaxID=1241935 RepID=M9UC29_SACIS|nr:type III-B CRISPR-associated protein Cas10/Cmr2 [Sulfolobus islandicus]AGJ62066.1 CRISPR-associated protein, Cas10 [Sulfolobus islandicus LAL14/1]
MSEDIFKIKTLALLHDPPWKPWSITSSIRGVKGGKVLEEIVGEFNLSYYNKSKDVHENEGLTFAKLLGIKDEEIEKYMEIVHKADRFSASLERYAVERGGSNVIAQGWKYNIFNVNHKIPLKKEIDKECIENYVRWIVNNIRNLGWREKYDTLYALIEVAWYHFCPGNYPLADTRVGTYSVFDHLYATASMVNWFLKGDLSGYLVKIDLPAIQQIISKARKAWDFWGGSYLLSWLTYETVEPLIQKYGVDIVLSPFMGLNPFFVSRLNLPKKIEDENTYWEFNDLMFEPTQPLMPATVLMALPEYENLKDLYEKAWEKIVNKLNLGIDKKLLSYPITPIRIKIVDLKELSKVKLKYDFSKFMYLLKLVNEEEKVVKVFYGITANSFANKITMEKYERKELYNLCTSCGILPAIIENDRDLEEGEKLCQYCYMKRKLHKYLENKYKMQLIPSTIDIANIYNWRDILEKEEEIQGAEKFAKDLRLPDPLRSLDTPTRRVMFYYYTTPPKEEDRLMLKYLKSGSLKTEEIYYAIVKGDGDFVGKKLWRGIVKGKSFEDYVKVVSRVPVKEIEEMEKEMKKIFNVRTSNGEIQIPVTPDYLITLSRALMVISLKDAKTVSEDGFLIYAGGDDVAFLAPISELSALKLLKNTRLNYWGADKLSDLNLESSEGAIGFLKLGNMIFDASIAYGRSYGVYITHYKDPFFYSWEIATQLEEMKDKIEGKDVTVILRGRGELNIEYSAILKNSEVEEVEKLYYEIKDKKELSKSFIKDVLGDEIVMRCTNNCSLLNSTLKYYVERNKLKKNVQYTPPQNINIIRAVDYFDDNYKR